MASLELITNLKLIDGSARTTVPTPEELPLGYMCFGIVNARASIWGNYDGSVHDLVEEGTYKVEIVQETGQSITAVMSQKAVTDKLDDKLDKGPIPEEYLPSYVDDVLEYDSKSAFPATGETGKIYIDKSTNLIYRWSGTTYIQVGGEDLNLENGTNDVLIQTTDTNRSFKVMTDGRAKVQSAPVDDNDVVRKGELDKIAEKITAEVSNVIPNIMSEQPLGFRRLVGQTRKTNDDINITSIYTIASEQAAIVPDRIPWYRAAGNPDSIQETPTATLPVCDPVWRFDAANKQYVDKKVDNNTDRIRCGDLYVAGAMGLIQAKQIQNPIRGNGVTVNDSLKVLIKPSQDTDVVRKIELDSKLDKSGGIISGSLTISKDLIVQGKTTSVDTQNLKVADKLIYVAKDNSIAVTSPAGMITPKYDGTNNGGIVYDSTGTAYVGDITLDSNGNVDTNNSDLQPIATRDTTITDGNIVKWNNAAKKLVDSGKSVDDLSTATNLANGTGDVLIQTTDSNQSFKVMTDGRAKVKSAPIDSDDVVRLNEFSVLTQEQVDLLF